MKLYIAEKPSLGREIVSALGGGKSDNGCIRGEGWTVTWAFGHLYEQAQPEDYDPALKKWSLDALPIVPEKWRLIPKKEATKQIAIIKGLLLDASLVIHCGDPDREGQLLIDEILLMLGWRGQTLRAWLPSLVTEDIRAQLKNMRVNDDPLYRGMSAAAAMRAKSDWLIGMNFTRAYTVRGREAGHDGVLSVGRVQSPTLALVVQRQREIDQFKAVPYFTGFADFTSAKGAYRGQWQAPEDARDPQGRVLQAAHVDAALMACQGECGRVESVECATKRKAPPLPFSLSALQVFCSARFGLGSQQVLDVAQSLYEKHKATTYPRTNCRYLADKQLADANRIFELIASLDAERAALVAKTDLSAKPAAFNDKKITAHTAIVPTMKKTDMSSFSAIERQVYDAVVLRYVMQFAGDYVYDATTVITTCTNHTFKTVGHVTRSAGWKQLNDKEDDDNTDDEDEEVAGELPALVANDHVTCEAVERLDKKTTPPGAFTEGTLIKAMASIASFVADPEAKKILKENDGIGTEGTRSEIIETLKTRGFIATKGKKFLPTESGYLFYDTLLPRLRDPISTAKLEHNLAALESGHASASAILDAVTKWVKVSLDEMLAMPMQDMAGEKFTCPTCQAGTLKRRSGKNGFFWGCDAYPDCKTTFQDKKGKPDLQPTIHNCPECKTGKLILREGKNGKFWGCNKFPECKATFDNNRNKPVVVVSSLTPPVSG